MTFDILPTLKPLLIPLVPRNLIDKINEDELVVFIGAGVPRIIGCKGWNELANNIVAQCYRLKLINCSEDEYLRKLDNKQKISKAYEIFEINGKKADFFEIIKKAVQCNGRKKSHRDIHEHIRKLRGVIVTTNVDEYFDECYYPNSIVYRVEEFKPDNISRDKIYHIHGSIIDNDSLVFTISEYFNRYKTKDFTAFIKEIFRRYTVLFIGYGLSDFEILDFVLTKFDQSSPENPVKHYYLNGYDEHQENLLVADKKHFEKLGIELIPYLKDKDDFGQLYNVVKAWSKEVNSISTYYSDTIDKIKSYINEFSVIQSADIVDHVIQLTKDNPVKRYFIENLLQSEDTLKWFECLYIRGFFELENFKGTKLYNFILNVMKQYKDSVYCKVMSILDNIISSKGHTDDWVSEKNIVLTLSLMPAEAIQTNHIDFIGQILQDGHSYSIDSIFGDSIGKTLLKGNRKDLFLRLLEYLLTSYKISRLSIQSEINTYWLAQFVDIYGEDISHLWSEEIIQLIVRVMKGIVSKNQYAFSVYEINAIDEISRDDFYSEFQAFLVKFLIVILRNVNSAENIVINLLSERHIIFKRIAVNHIDINYSTFKKVFWNWNINPLAEIDLKHEVFKLFENHSKEFSGYHINTCIYWIESVSYYVPEEKLTRKDEIVACCKKEWLFSLRGSGNSKIEDAYERYNSINPSMSEHPGYDVWYSSSQPVENNAAIKKNEMQELDVSQLVEYLRRLEEYNKDNITCEHETLWALENCVKEQPCKYIKEIDKLLYITPLYQIQVLSGFTDACKEGYPLSRDILWDFCNKLIALHELGNRSNNKNIDCNNREWVARNIVKLIELNVSDDNQELSIELIKKGIDILFKVIDTNDITNYEYKYQSSVNCESYSAIIQCLLQTAKIKSTSKDETFKFVLSKFEGILECESGSIDLRIILCKYLSQLYSLKADWVKNNVLVIFDWLNSDNFKTSLRGYFQNITSVDKSAYLLLKNNNVLKQAIELDVSKELQDDGHFIQYILVAFLHNFEGAKKLATRIIFKKDPSQIDEIIHFFSKKPISNEIQLSSKIKFLFMRIVKTLWNQSNKQLKDSLFKLTKWIVLLNNNDFLDAFESIKKCIHCGNRGGSYYLITGLKDHFDNSPEKVGELLLEVIEQKKIFNPSEEEIKEDLCYMVQKLSEEENKDIATRISNAVLKNGYTFLRGKH